MGLSNIKARLLKYRSASSNSFDGVAQATNEHGAVVLYVYYMTIGNVFLITGFSVNPFATVKEAQHAGDCVDELLEREAHLAGISALHILTPGQDRCEEVRTYRKLSPVSFATEVGYNSNPNAHVN